MEIDCTSYDCMDVSLSGEPGAGEGMNLQRSMMMMKMKKNDKNVGDENVSGGKQQGDEKNGVVHHDNIMDVDMQSV
jgi:hypothetical protein